MMQKTLRKAVKNVELMRKLKGLGIQAKQNEYRIENVVR